jgi:predicted alpha/beta hydrolase
MFQGVSAPAEEDLELLADDGFPLVGTAFEAAPGRLPRPAVVVVAPATGVARGYYAAFARFLAGRGFDVLSFDYRGMGDSRAVWGDASLAARMSDWGALDLGAALEWASERHPGARPLVVGHSAGGQLVGLGRGTRPLGGVLAIAAQSGACRHWPAPSRQLLGVYWRLVVPALVALLGRLPAWAGVGTELPGGVAREWARWCLSPNYLLDHLGVAERAAYATLDAPILAFSFEGDFYAPRPAVEAWLGFFPAARRSHRHVERAERGDVGHFGFFSERQRETLWQEAAAWLESRVGG